MYAVNQNCLSLKNIVDDWIDQACFWVIYAVDDAVHASEIEKEFESKIDFSFFLKL